MVDDKLAQLNVLIIGKTGVGKSTLVNSIFGESITEEGLGKPVTQKIHKIEKMGMPISIYDTPGLELGGNNSADNLLKEMVKLVRTCNTSGDQSQMIHCVCYCINTLLSKIEPAELEFLKNFIEKTKKYNIPIIVVLTQALQKNCVTELKREIEQEKLSIVQVIPVLAKDYHVDGQGIIKAFGVDKLIDIMFSVLPDDQKDTFAAIQMSNLDLKQKAAYKAVKIVAAAAATTGAVPIPFSDAALLIPTQVTMLMHITTIFHIPIQKAALTTIATMAIGTMGTTFIGKTVVSNIFKMIPGIGTVTGGAISATTAAFLTTALGNAYIKILIKISKGEMRVSDLTTKEGQKILKQELNTQLREKRDR